jgi:hypothetical protein
VRLGFGKGVSEAFRQFRGNASRVSKHRSGGDAYDSNFYESSCLERLRFRESVSEAFRQSRRKILRLEPLRPDARTVWKGFDDEAGSAFDEPASSRNVEHP